MLEGRWKDTDWPTKKNTEIGEAIGPRNENSPRAAAMTNSILAREEAMSFWKPATVTTRHGGQALIRTGKLLFAAKGAFSVFP